MLGSVVLLTPAGALVGVAVALPLGALALAARRVRRTREALRPEELEVVRLLERRLRIMPRHAETPPARGLLGMRTRKRPARLTNVVSAAPLVPRSSFST